jgi:hypothetical protein
VKLFKVATEFHQKLSLYRGTLAIQELITDHPQLYDAGKEVRWSGKIPDYARLLISLNKSHDPNYEILNLFSDELVLDDSQLSLIQEMIKHESYKEKLSHFWESPSQENYQAIFSKNPGMLDLLGIFLGKSNFFTHVSENALLWIIQENPSVKQTQLASGLIRSISSTELSHYNSLDNSLLSYIGRSFLFDELLPFIEALEAVDDIGNQATESYETVIQVYMEEMNLDEIIENLIDQYMDEKILANTYFEAEMELSKQKKIAKETVQSIIRGLLSPGKE